MSVGAHVINKLDYDQSQIFNLWHDREFVELLPEHAWYPLNEDACGMMELSRDDIYDMKEYAKQEETKEILCEIEKIMDNRKEDYLTFYCY